MIATKPRVLIKGPRPLSPAEQAAEALRRGDAVSLAGCPEGFDAVVLAGLARSLADERAPVTLIHVAVDGPRMERLAGGLGFTAPGVEVLKFPAWDCQPYDRVSPAAAVAAERMTTLARLARSKAGEERPRVLLTTVNALVQRVPPRARVAAETFSAAPGNLVDTGDLAAWLDANGFQRASTVRDTGEYAVRGGIVDLYAPGAPAPVRLDFFGDALESIRSFDPETQRTVGQLRALDLVPVSEVRLSTETIRRFRTGYIAAFGAPSRDDPLYEAVSEGRRHPGLEHWLPLFDASLDTLLDYAPGRPVVIDAAAASVAVERLAGVADYYEARRSPLARAAGGAAYHPLPPDALYLRPDEATALLEQGPRARLSPFAEPHDPARGTLDLGGRAGRSFAPERADPSRNLFEAAAEHLGALRGRGLTTVLAAWTAGSRERLAGILADHALQGAEIVTSLDAARALGPGKLGLAVWGLETGFETDDLAVLGEQDILGDRLVRPQRRARKAEALLLEASSLAAGDLVVHAEHGIARFLGLRTVAVGGAPHDCLELAYAGSDKLFLPVENIELLTRYGSEDAEAALDRLGGAGWQARKARLKKRIREMAGQLMQVAAARALKEAPRLVPPEGLYDEFRARFPYEETEDQAAAISATLGDLAAGRPMDRLICGDVGFGKTEVALRAAFASVMAGKQVAVVVPTTLLARQHHKTFADRFAGLPVNVAQASRFVPGPEMKTVKSGLASGEVDIVAGTHALLSKGVSFKDLGLVIVDEEQHFGVAHKEKLKDLRAEVHVLTLSATPIPRTLQLAMTGVRELSLIATPPVDRLAVRSFVMPFDPVIVREALLRERYRGGQSFYVCPRIEDIAEVRRFLEQSVPEVKVGVGHGQMAAAQLEDVMAAFYDGRYDVLLSTTIVESGLDIPRANTLIVHRADMFGLAQLYQLRGRVGRSKARAYALFTTPATRKVTDQAEKRLKVLQSLDGLGAGFQLASHDLDLRGAGNLLGEEQSGHIREVGYELYQQMLKDAVEALKSGASPEDGLKDEAWSPTIAVGVPVTIPEAYVEDLALRLNLYRRLSSLAAEEDITAFGAELADRFGPVPEEVDQLLKVVAIKALCRRANIAKLDAGPKGIVIAFREGAYANPAGLVSYVAKLGAGAKVRGDMTIVFVRDLAAPDARLRGATNLVRDLARIAERPKG